MFPLPWNKEYRNKDGSLSTLEAAMKEVGGSNIPAHTSEDAGKVLTVGEDGELEWDESGGAGGPPYIGYDVPDDSLGADGDFYMQVRNVYEVVPLIPAQSDGANTICSNEWISSPAYGNGWHLFDGNDSTFWSTQENRNTNEYCGFDFGTGNEVIVNKVGINPREFNGIVQAHDFKIQASNDNETWVDIYAGSLPNHSGTPGHMNYFTFDNSTAYRYYRLFVIDANSSKTITVFEMQLYANKSNLLNIEEVGTYKKTSGSWVEVT